jgi:hypothetical protein
MKAISLGVSKREYLKDFERTVWMAHIKTTTEREERKGGNGREVSEKRKKKKSVVARRRKRGGRRAIFVQPNLLYMGRNKRARMVEKIPIKDVVLLT